MVIVSALIAPSAGTNGGYLSYSVTGTSSVSPTDLNAQIQVSASNAVTPAQGQASNVSTIAITAGSNNTFTLQYKESGGPATFSNRTITVVPLN